MLYRENTIAAWIMFTWQPSFQFILVPHNVYTLVGFYTGRTGVVSCEHALSCLTIHFFFFLKIYLQLQIKHAGVIFGDRLKVAQQWKEEKNKNHSEIKRMTVASVLGSS